MKKLLLLLVLMLSLSLTSFAQSVSTEHYNTVYDSTTKLDTHTTTTAVFDGNLFKIDIDNTQFAFTQTGQTKQDKTVAGTVYFYATYKNIMSNDNIILMVFVDDLGIRLIKSSGSYLEFYNK